VTRKKLEIIAPPDKPTIMTSRVFDAPRELVFEAWTNPEYMRRWLGPRRLTWVVCEVDLRVGGKYRWVQRAPDGTEYSFHGVYMEIVRPEKLVGTFVFDLSPQDEAIDTLTLQEQGGKTIATVFTTHKTIKGRDAHLSGGAMEIGMSEGFERLDELLPSVRPRSQS
jgi:uncharacterized protein YndB with AHSA1/START domain